MTRVRVPPLSIGLISIILTAIFAPLTVSMVGRGGDYVLHMRYAILWEQDGLWGKPLPHFLYQSLLIFFKGLLPGQNFPLAAAVIITFSYLVLGLTLYILFYHLLPNFHPKKRVMSAIILTVIIMLVAPINLLTRNAQNQYFGYIAIQSYHNPTVILLRPLALWLFLFAVRVFRDKPTSVSLVLLCTAIAMLLSITKPNYGIAILPALALLTLVALYRKKPIDWRLLLVGIVVPIVTVIIWQYFYYRSQGIGGFSIAPFQVMNFLSPIPGSLLPKFLLSCAFPLCVFVLYFKTVTLDIALRLAWIAFMFGVFYTYFLMDALVWQAGNFIWSGEITLFLLFVTSTFFVLRQYLATRKWTWQLTICAVVLTFHLISGLAFYPSHFNDNWNSWY